MNTTFIYVVIILASCIRGFLSSNFKIHPEIKNINIDTRSTSSCGSKASSTVWDGNQELAKTVNGTYNLRWKVDHAKKEITLYVKVDSPLSVSW